MWRFLDPRGGEVDFRPRTVHDLSLWKGMDRERERDLYGYLKKNGKELTGTREEYFELSLRVENKIIVSETVIIRRVNKRLRF